MLIIKSNGNLDKLNAILDKMADNEEGFVVLLPFDFNDNGAIERLMQMGGDYLLYGDDWLWVTDDNWDGDLSGILPSVG